MFCVFGDDVRGVGHGETLAEGGRAIADDEECVLMEVGDLVI
jgi:hypothetical protein